MDPKAVWKPFSFCMFYFLCLRLKLFQEWFNGPRPGSMASMAVPSHPDLLTMPDGHLVVREQGSTEDLSAQAMPMKAHFTKDSLRIDMEIKFHAEQHLCRAKVSGTHVLPER